MDDLPINLQHMHFTSQQLRRVQKVFTESFYVLDVNRSLTGSISYSISGSRLDVYTITVAQSTAIRCNCPDSKSHARRHGCLCKHICFLLLRVLKVTDDQPFYNGTVPTSLYEWMTRCQPENLRQLREANEDPELTNRYKDAKHPTPAERRPKKFSTKTVDPEDECSICFEPLVKDTSQCPGCHNVFHDSCILKWLQQQKSTCPLCRSSEWKSFINAIQSAAGYINLSV